MILPGTELGWKLTADGSLGYCRLRPFLVCSVLVCAWFSSSVRLPRARRHVMADNVNEETRYSASDVVAVAVYSVVVILLLLTWAYVPA